MRRRLSPDARRRQLLEVGARMFAARPYEEVLMEEIAEAAGVSRALLYRHFPGKRDLFAAVYRDAAEGLLKATELDPDESFEDQLVRGLDTHFDYFAANRSAVLAANQTLAGDPTIQAIIFGELGELRQRILDVSGLGQRERGRLAAILAAWLLFVRVMVIDWLTNDTMTQAELRAASVGALLGAMRESHIAIRH